MALFPQTPRPISPYPFKNQWPTVAGGPMWAPQNRNLTRFGLLQCDITYHGRSWADVQSLWAFFESIGGQAGRFTYIDWNGVGVPGGADPGVPWAGLYVATGDGYVCQWDMPTYALQSSPAPVIKEAGSVKTSDIYTTTPDFTKAYHIKVGAGTDGVDLLTAGVLTTVATAPSPATSGTSLVVAAGVGAHLPGTPFYANTWPAGTVPSVLNVESLHVTGVSTDTLTIVRAQNGTTARAILIGDPIVPTPIVTNSLVTVDATCRRALRRAKFASDLQPFTLNVPVNYYIEQVTILEVRR